MVRVSRLDVVLGHVRRCVRAGIVGATRSEVP